MKRVGPLRIDIEQDKYVQMISVEDNRTEKYPFLKDQTVQYYFTRFMENQRGHKDVICCIENSQQPVEVNRKVESFNQCPLTFMGTLSLVIFTHIVINKLSLEIRSYLKLPSSVHDWKLVQHGYKAKDRSQYLSFCIFVLFESSF